MLTPRIFSRRRPRKPPRNVLATILKKFSPQNPKKQPNVDIFSLSCPSIHFKLLFYSSSVFLGGCTIKRVEMVMMVNKKKLAPPPKRAATTIPPSAVHPSVAAPATPKAQRKWPRPTEGRDDWRCRSISKAPKKKAKKGERDIHTISSQTTRSTSPSAPFSFIKALAR